MLKWSGIMFFIEKRLRRCTVEAYPYVTERGNHRLEVFLRSGYVPVLFAKGKLGLLRNFTPELHF
jgi:hypothetical protein